MCILGNPDFIDTTDFEIFIIILYLPEVFL